MKEKINRHSDVFKNTMNGEGIDEVTQTMKM
jgi:hypothetical protein